MIIEKDSETYSIEQFEKMTGIQWQTNLTFKDFHLVPKIKKKAAKLYKKGEMTLEQIWLGKYFQKEIETNYTPDVAIRWIDSILGWGVFASRDFKKMEFIAEYVGTVRKSMRADRKNAYCFEYPIASGMKTPYTIDALECGSIARFINHSENANLNSSLATFDDVGHIILYTKKPLAKETQLCYDYGPNYWSKRTKPLPI